MLVNRIINNIFIDDSILTVQTFDDDTPFTGRIVNYTLIQHAEPFPIAKTRSRMAFIPLKLGLASLTVGVHMDSRTAINAGREANISKFENAAAAHRTTVYLVNDLRRLKTLASEKLSQGSELHSLTPPSNIQNPGIVLRYAGQNSNRGDKI